MPHDHSTDGVQGLALQPGGQVPPSTDRRTSWQGALQWHALAKLFLDLHNEINSYIESALQNQANGGSESTRCVRTKESLPAAAITSHNASFQPRVGRPQPSKLSNPTKTH